MANNKHQSSIPTDNASVDSVGSSIPTDNASVDSVVSSENSLKLLEDVNTLTSNSLSNHQQEVLAQYSINGKISRKLLTQEVIDKLSMEDASLVLAALLAQDKEGDKPSKTAKAVKPSFELKPFESGRVIHLSELVHLKQVPLTYASMGLRPIDEKNVVSLAIAYRRGASIPPIKVVGSTLGPVIVAGYHRVAAQRANIIEDMRVNPAWFNSKGELNSDGDLELGKRLVATPVDYVQITCSLRDLPKIAYQDNLTNGLPPTEKSKSNYALWLIKEAKEHGERLSVQEAANIVGVSRIAVYRQGYRNEGVTSKKVTQLQEVPLSPNEEMEKNSVYDALDSSSRPDALQTAMTQILRATAKIMDEQMTPEMLFEYALTFTSEKPELNNLLVFLSNAFKNIQPVAIEETAK